ncbi:pilus assembly FimT family protein [Duganella sp. P38]|uniref:pilus assembly FimT family protein n=1 Tax=Duganella sp. P38 TaxID=3423949 RepID=UPI003D7AF734
MNPGFSKRRQAGFTMVELITVIILMGILGAIGASRFFDDTAFENRAYADQAKAIIRYAQKLAVTENRFIFVRTDGNSFAICATLACGGGSLVNAPGGSNSGSRATRANCLQAGVYRAAWMCEGRPASVNVNGLPGNAIYFDALGRPYNGTDAIGNPSTFVAAQVIRFTSGANASQITIWPETGYVQ